MVSAKAWSHLLQNLSQIQVSRISSGVPQPRLPGHRNEDSVHYHCSRHSIFLPFLFIEHHSSNLTPRLSGFHIRTVWSSEHDANIFGFLGLHATEFTLPLPCPVNSSKSAPDSRCQTYTLPSVSTAQIRKGSIENQTGMICK